MFLVLEMCGSINFPYLPQGGKLSIPTPRRVIGNFRGGGRVLKCKIFKKSVNHNCIIQRDFKGEELGSLTKEALCGWGMNIFWLIWWFLLLRGGQQVTVTEWSGFQLSTRRKGKTKVITLANQKGYRLANERKYMQPPRSAGKRVRLCHAYMFF